MAATFVHTNYNLKDLFASTGYTYMVSAQCVDTYCIKKYTLPNVALSNLMPWVPQLWCIVTLVECMRASKNFKDKKLRINVQNFCL